ncbi:MAG TPA: hypothetical protein VLI70_01840 [Micrococcaceae bacterium]|jgi:uncharacterized protein|nr:hypothetical protein [Micrococcaceae bacterium]
MTHVRDELLAVLRCPVTKASLVQDGDELVSTVAGPEGRPLRYRIADDIPLLILPEKLTDTAAPAGPGAPAGPADPATPETTDVP